MQEQLYNISYTLLLLSHIFIIELEKGMFSRI